MPLLLKIKTDLCFALHDQYYTFGFGGGTLFAGPIEVF